MFFWRVASSEGMVSFLDDRPLHSLNFFVHHYRGQRPLCNAD